MKNVHCVNTHKTISNFMILQNMQTVKTVVWSCLARGNQKQFNMSQTSVKVFTRNCSVCVCARRQYRCEPVAHAAASEGCDRTERYVTVGHSSASHWAQQCCRCWSCCCHCCVRCKCMCSLFCFDACLVVESLHVNNNHLPYLNFHYAASLLHTYKVGL